MLLFLTYRCNLHCSFCLSFNSYWEAESNLNLPSATQPKLSLHPVKPFKEMSTSQIIDRVIPQCVESGVKVISLSGGEILVRSDIDVIFRELGKSNIKWCFDSNMMLCTESIAQEIVNASCDSILVSLEGPREIHNKLRRNPKAFDRTLAGLGQLLQARKQAGKTNPTVMLNCVIQPGNEMAPPAIIEIANDFGVDGVYFQLLSDKKYEQPFAAETAFDSVKKALAKASDLNIPVSFYPVSNPTIKDFTSWFSMPLSHDFYKGCTYIYKDLRIDPEGNIIPCLEYKLGNILDQDLLDIWNGPNYKAFRKHQLLEGPFEACLRCCNT